MQGTDTLTRTLLSTIITLVFSAVAVANDNGMWTWVSGSNLEDQDSVYGTKGVASPGNIPGGRKRGVSWVDRNDNLWLFGGGNNGYGPDWRARNDLWKFDGTNWTWVSGSTNINQAGVYGTKGVAAPGNCPGARVGSVSWSDNNGNFWLFGGVGFDVVGIANYQRDLWRYNLSSGLWTWVGGESHPSMYGYYAGYYGIKGVAAPENWPGGREGGVTWVDSSGNLWLFGGVGWYSAAFGDLSDLWKYEPSSGLWTWVSGSNVGDQHGVYGTKGVANPNNSPGARRYSVSWKDDHDNLWLFGGHGYAATGDWVLMNDLWKFDGVNWTWFSGSDIGEQPGVYGSKGAASPANTPGAKRQCLSWADHSGNLWLFGPGNDLWKYNLSSGMWTWVSGSKSGGGYPQGVYGTLGIASPDNVPGGRTAGISWVDSFGNLRLFGGEGFSTVPGSEHLLNDLWKFGNNYNSSLQFGNIYGTKNNNLIVNDANNMLVTFSLTGGGYGEIIGDANFDQLNLYNTTEKSQLTITSKSETNIGDINSNGPLKGITAKTAKLSGSITIGASTNPITSVIIIFDRSDELNINSQMPIKSISATEWLGGIINSPSIGNITIKGDKKRNITGDLDIDIEADNNIASVKVAGELSGQWNVNAIKSITAFNLDNFNLNLRQVPDSAGKVLALGTLTVKSYFIGSSIKSAGHIGKVTTGIMADSSCFAGVDENIIGLPSAQTASFPVSASIKNIAIKGISTEMSPYYINSNIAAANILSASIIYPQSDNGGTPFGLTADNINKLTIKKMDGTIIKDPKSTWTFENLEIRLY